MYRSALGQWGPRKLPSCALIAVSLVPLFRFTYQSHSQATNSYNLGETLLPKTKTCSSWIGDEYPTIEETKRIIT